MTKSCDYGSREERVKYLPTAEEIEAGKAEIKARNLAKRQKLYCWASGPLGHGGIRVLQRRCTGRIGALTFQAEGRLE
jgi:hypothetical protein